MRRFRLGKLCEAAISRHAEHRQIDAKIRLPSTTGITRTTALDRADRDAITLLETIGAGNLAKADNRA